jgi:serine/threonine protein kinase/dipeptidyl aminopeptidase/acylaminoacyl peptidase
MILAMTPERWAQIDQLLAQALEIPAAERAAFLAEACGDDAELRSEVESLLVAHLEAEADFLSTPAPEMALRELAKERQPSFIGQSLVGTTFGQYDVLSVLGVGGMGEVYLARDERLGRKLALKILPPRFVADNSRIERFAREARAVSALNHPNIVTIYDIGQSNGTHFIAMEHVDGQTLREKIPVTQQEPMEVKEVVEIALQISAALAAAHEAGIIHRDIKPENLMLRRDDYVKVVDFGLAKLTEPERSLAETLAENDDPAATNPGTVLGTLRYMSPEQALGKDVDGRSDLFSLGTVLYELLTGSPPFKGHKPAAILDAVVHHKPLPLTQLLPDLPLRFEQIITRLLEKDRDLRFQSADELRAALKQLKRELDSAPAHALNSDSSGENDLVQTASPRLWLNAKNVVAVAVALAIIGLVAWWFWLSNKDEPSPWLNAYSSQITDFPGEERFASLSPDGKSVFYSRRVQGQTDIFWQRIGSGNPTNLTAGNDSNDEQPACSPTGASVVFRSERNGGGLFVMSASGENVQRIVNFGHNPSWSPDEQHIVCGTDYTFNPKLPGVKSRVVIINIASRQQRVLVENEDASQPRWSPGGQRIAYYRNRRDIWTIGADGSDPRPVTDDDAVDWNPVWSSDGKYLYFASDRKAAASLWRVRIDQATGRTLGKPESVTGPTAEVLQMDVARDGRRIVYVTRVQDANIKAIGFDPVKLAVTGEANAITQGTRPSGSPSLSPDGQWVAFHSLGAPQEDIWLKRADGIGAQTNLTNDAPIDRSPRWSPDGQHLAFVSFRSKPSQVWLMNPDGSDKRQLTFAESDCNTPFWSPNGRRIAWQLTSAAEFGNEARKRKRGTQIIETDKPWDQQTPVTLPDVNQAGDWFNAYHWSPDGKRLVGTVAGLQGQEVRARPGLFLYSFETNRYEKLTDFGQRPEWLADNRHILFTYAGKGQMAEQQVWLVDTQTKIVKYLITHPTQIISTLGLTRDNRRLFFTATDHQSDIHLLSLDK